MRSAVKTNYFKSCLNRGMRSSMDSISPFLFPPPKEKEKKQFVLII